MISPRKFPVSQSYWDVQVGIAYVHMKRPFSLPESILDGLRSLHLEMQAINGEGSIWSGKAGNKIRSAERGGSSVKDHFTLSCSRRCTSNSENDVAHLAENSCRRHPTWGGAEMEISSAVVESASTFPKYRGGPASGSMGIVTDAPHRGRKGLSTLPGTSGRSRGIG